MNTSAIEAAGRRAAMAALEKGIKAGCEYMTELLKMTVSGPSITAEPGAKPPIQYRRATKRGGKWEKYPDEWKGAKRMHTGTPPGIVSGNAMRSIGYKIIERNFDAGTIRVIIGVDASAPGRMKVNTPYSFAPSYLLGHEYGIRYPTRGPMKGTGPVIQHPWLLSTIKRYWDSMMGIVNAVAAGR